MRYMLLIYDDESTASGDERGARCRPTWETVVQPTTASIKGSRREARRARRCSRRAPRRPCATTAASRSSPTARSPETPEQLGGYYLLDVANLDEAIAWAHKCPARGTARSSCARSWSSSRADRARPRSSGGRRGRPHLPRRVRPRGRDPRPRRSAATSTAPRRPCRTPTPSRWTAGRATASRPTGGWILTTAKRRAIDRLRREAALREQAGAARARARGGGARRARRGRRR